MLFKRDVLAAIARGEVAVAFRRWRRPTVRAGSRLRTAVGVLLIESVEPVEMEAITEQSAREAGYPSREATLQHLTGTEGSIYRIGFRVAGEDARVALREEVPPDRPGFEAAAAALERLDRRSPWTRRFLELIRRNPGAPAQALADEEKMERLAFKRRVRQLKELGLTESLPVGYRLSPRGEALVEYLESRNDP